MVWCGVVFMGIRMYGYLSTKLSFVNFQSWASMSNHGQLMAAIITQSFIPVIADGVNRLFCHWLTGDLWWIIDYAIDRLSLIIAYHAIHEQGLWFMGVCIQILVSLISNHEESNHGLLMASVVTQSFILDCWWRIRLFCHWLRGGLYTNARFRSCATIAT